MGDFEPRTRKSGSKIRPFSSSFGGSSRQDYSYNSSSLAIDLQDRDAEDAHPLYLVHARPAEEHAAHLSVPTFGNLDTALQQRSPQSRIISAVVHACLIGLVLWLGMHIRPVTAPPMNVTHVDFK